MNLASLSFFAGLREGGRNAGHPRPSVNVGGARQLPARSDHPAPTAILRRPWAGHDRPGRRDRVPGDRDPDSGPSARRPASPRAFLPNITALQGHSERPDSTQSGSP